MKKSILKNVAILTLALFGLGIIGNNVLIGGVMYPAPPPGDGGEDKNTQGMRRCPLMELTCVEGNAYDCTTDNC